MFLRICRSWQKVNSAAFYFGTAAIVPFSLLWIPVSRGSVLLRIVRIPFERAVRYHIWLANLMILLVTLHSIGYIVFYYYNGQAELVDIYIHMSQQEAIHSYAQNYQIFYIHLLGMYLSDQILYAYFGHVLFQITDFICIFYIKASFIMYLTNQILYASFIPKQHSSCTCQNQILHASLISKHLSSCTCEIRFHMHLVYQSNFHRILF